MSDLTDFLLARIAEDQAVAREFIAEGPWQEWALRDTAGPSRDDEYAQLTIGAARVLAECEAKRRIVDDNQDCTWGCGDDPNCHNCITLAHLALPYVEHDDFREEWRV